MSTTINSETTATVTLTEAILTATNSMENAGNKKVVIVDTVTTSKGAADGGADVVAENNTTLPVLLLSSSPCPTSCSSSSSWSDVLCANAMCSSSSQKQQSSQQQPPKYEKEEEQKQKIKDNTSGHNENLNAYLNKTTTTVIPTFSLISHLAASQSNLTTATTTSIQLLKEQQDTSAVDSGRESVNECDSSLDDSINYASTHPSPAVSSASLKQQRNKKPCTLDFYASSGSQSKWYLPPRDIVKINVQPSDLVLSAMTKSCASIAEPESSVITPPTDQGCCGVGEADVAQGDREKGATDKIFTRTTSATATTTATSTAANDGISMLRNGFPANLSHQIRAVSSPSLTTDNAGSVTATQNDNNILVHQRVPSSNSSYTTASHEVCQTSSTTTTTNAASTTTTAPQNVGVLQKFKRTLTNFNKHQQSSAAATNQITSTNGTNTTTATRADSSAFIIADSEMQTDVLDGCSNSAGNGTGVSNKYRFGPLVWRTSKERRKTKYNRRDKCNSGDSGIQIELENDEQFARVLAASGNGSSAGGVGGGGISNIMMNATATSVTSVNGSSFNRKQEGMNSLRVRSVRRTNSAKVSASIDEIKTTKPTTTSATQTSKANILKRIDMHNEREAPESLPTRSLSQPNGLESCGMTRNDLDDSDSDSVTSHEEASNYYPIYAEVLYNFTAAGPQELGLEKGTLIEILRKEIGPWWFGRIKKEDASLVEEILDPELGWFPKEFVRVIHSPETDFFYLQHMAEQQQEHNNTEQHCRQQQQLQQQKQNDAIHTSHHELTENNAQIGNHTMNTSSSAPCALANGSCSSNNFRNDNCNATVIDQHNVTTIVIESSPSSTQQTQPPQSQFVGGIEKKANAKVNENISATTTTTAKCLTVNHLATTNSGTTSSSSSSNGSGQAILSTSQSLNVIMDSADILRKSAVKELLDTEVNYVKLLSAICEGYLPAMSKRIDIFSPNSIRLIFSNITAIYKFQRRFLDALRKGIEQNQVAKVFLKMHKGFLCYSTYCNAYPRALIELASYERVKDARTILDNCRESENLAELPLSAHLLAPVQRICRYPLHLGEMIKSSVKGAEPPAFSLPEFEQIDVSQLDIPDTTETIDMALEAMKSVTEAVNEGKRHSETIARHQASFQNFKGPPLHLHSTRFFLQIDATRQKQNLWNSSCTLFLFDNQLVYCKRDIIKRSNFIYKGRIFLDRCRVVNVRDGKMFGHTIKNSLRIYCEARDKWFDFSFRSANRKHRFLNTLALERQFGGKSLYISEMTGFEYAFDERGDYSDQSDYEGGGGDSGEVKLKEFLYETNLNTGNNTNTSGESSVPESPAKTFKYSDTLPHKKTQRLDATVPTAAPSANDSQTGSLGRRRLGNWFRKPKSSASTPNQSPTHKPTQTAYSTGDLQLTGTDITETYTVFEHTEIGGGGGVSS